MAQGSTIPPLCPRAQIGPLIAALPPATIATEPPSKVLPLLSPILRQRVQLLSHTSAEPWIRLLCYDPSKVPRLSEIAASSKLEPHPASGEIEIDWDNDLEVRYKRLDEETMQALVLFLELGLLFRMVFCVVEGDTVQTGWRVGEVSISGGEDYSFSGFGNAKSIDAAEREFRQARMTTTVPAALNATKTTADDEEEEDDDAGYWDRYDATPGRTPAGPRSPVPMGSQLTIQDAGLPRPTCAEDAYFAQYDSVQPAMDPHDPDEASQQALLTNTIESAAKNASVHEVYDGQSRNVTKTSSRMGAILEEDEDEDEDEGYDNNTDTLANLVHTRPKSNSSSSGLQTVARLEETAERLGSSETGIRKHISNTIFSLYELANAAGIQQSEFLRLATSALEALGPDKGDD